MTLAGAPAIACSRSASSSQPPGQSFFRSTTFSTRLIDLSGFHVEFAQIFECALVLGVELEGLAVEGVGLLVVAGLAQAKAHQVVDIGVLMGLEHRGELRDRGLVILGLDLGAHGGEVRRVAGGDVIDGERAGGSKRGADEQHRKPKRRRFHDDLRFDCVSQVAIIAAHVFMTVNA